MYVCSLDFDLFDEGKCFSFNKGQVFDGHLDCIKRLLVLGYICEYNFNRPAIRFTSVGIKFFTPRTENKNGNAQIHK